MTATTVSMTVYSRPGCHICDEALDQLLAIGAEHPALEIVVVDIDGDDELLKRYLERIPVVTIAGEEVSDLVLDVDAVKSRLGNP